MILLLFYVGNALLVLPYGLQVISPLSVKRFELFLYLFHPAFLELFLYVALCVDCIAIEFS